VKIGYGNYGMPETPYPTLVQQVKEIGFDGLEICVKPEWPTSPQRLTTVDRTQFSSMLNGINLDITAFMGTPGKLTETDPAQHSANLDGLRRVLELSADMGVERAVVIKTDDGQIDDWDQLRSRTAENLFEWVQICHEAGAVLALEPHVGKMLYNPNRSLWMLKEVNHPALRLNFDFSHFEAIGESLQESIDKLIQYTVATHLKDVVGRYPNSRFALPGETAFDYTDFVLRMYRGGYNGYLTSEVSMLVSKSPNYDALISAEFCYKTISTALTNAGIPRG